MRPAQVPGPARALRLFFVFAVLSLVPVLALGVVLAAAFRADANARGLSESRSQAELFAHSAIQPLLASSDLDDPLTARQVGGLRYLGQAALASGDIVRFRLRDSDGRVVFSSDSTIGGIDDEALEAARGETVAQVTELNADAEDGVAPGIRVAEVYVPVTDEPAAHRHGVLELYLPYQPISQDIDSGLHTLYRDLAIGLALLWVVLAGISWWATRRLRSQVSRNAYLAEHDQLTGLANRATFLRRLDQAIAASARSHQVVGVVLVDLDRFQEVNDTLGHSVGDALLVELAQHLGAALAGPSTHDVIARLGGDEFGVVVTCADQAALRDSVDGVRRLVNREFDLFGLPLEVESSIGVAQTPWDGADAGTLLQHADVAMYLAKRHGGGVAFYDRDLDQFDAERLSLVADMRRALASDELVLYFQPKIDVASGTVDSVEALLRWHHPERGLLMPDRFLPVVEQTGMIDPMTAWVLDAALDWATTAAPTVAGLRVAINVSARNLVHATFPDQVVAALDRHRVAAGRLCVEVTETALVTDQHRVLTSLRRLAAAGVRVSIDDFGQGQTSLSQLSVLPLHEVKIDKEFVGDMCEVGAHAAIVGSMIDLAHNLGFEVVAEGVETEPVLDALRLAGCDIAQGYLIARPMPADRLADWLREHQCEGRPDWVVRVAPDPDPEVVLLGTPI